MNPSIVIGPVVIKHICNLNDRETTLQITENMYMQYFLGYSGFSKEPPFDASLFVEIRKRIGDELINEMNLCILNLSKSTSSNSTDSNDGPLDIAYLTDLNLLNKSREISESIIDKLHVRGEAKPRRYRKIARKFYFQVAQNRNPSSKKVRSGIGNTTQLY